MSVKFTANFPFDGRPNGARISPCERYRTLLWRTISDGPAPPLAFCMLNPSTADAENPDATITRLLERARRAGASGIVVVNLSPFRATDPAELYAAHAAGVDVMCSDENREMMQIARNSGPLILAWGAGWRPFLEPAARYVLGLHEHGKALCYGKTNGGQPRHPLMLAYSTPLERF